MKKRILSILLTLCLVLMLCPVTAAAAGDTGWCDNCRKETSGIWHDVYDTANMQYNEKQHTTQLFQCSVCRGATYTWVDHEWDDTPWPYIGKCRICNAPRSEVLDHEHVQSASIVTIKEPTCTENGVKIMVCGTPGCYYAVETCTAFKLLHKYKSIEPSRAATCTEPFYVGAAVCERCGDKQEGYYDGEPLGHDLESAEWHTLNGKTCAEATEIGLICTWCDAVIEKKTVTPAKCAKENLYVVHPGYPATCLNRGFTRATVCDLCGKQYGGKWIDPLGHDFEGAEWTFITAEPTCQHGGWRARFCTREGCNKYEYASQVPAIDHDYSMLYSEEVPATCTEAGTTAKYKCTMCTLEQGGTIGGETIEPLGHSTEGAEWEIVRKATCQQTGEKVLRCTRENCGEIMERQEIPKACHPDDQELIAEAVHETCETPGYTAKYRCKLCGTVTGGEWSSPIGHNMSGPWDVRIIKEATCTEPGLKGRNYCQNWGCDYAESYQPIQELGHHMVTVEAKAATCTEIGWDAYSACDREGCTYTEGYKEYPALGHDTALHEAKLPTCTEVGWDAYETCTRCDYSTYAEIPALGHDTVLHDAKKQTCTEVGWDAYESCSRCDYSTYAELPALGHEIERVIGQKPTCTEGGWDPYEACMREGCTYNTRVEKPALGHKLLHYDGQAPTCTSTGWKDFDVCTRCTYSTFEELDALGHAMEKNYDAKAPTCTEGGWGAYVGCANEGCSYYSLREEFPALGHDIELHEAKDPTCEDNGWDAYESCTRCDYSTYQEVPALNHEAEYHEAQAPTCTEIGWDAYYTCKHDDCDYSSYRELPALGHDIEQHEAQAPTCAEIGWYAYETCTRCNHSTYREIPALGNHQDENKDHKCDYCGVTFSEHTGGTATCRGKAVCEYCGEEYGELDSENHAGGTENHGEAQATYLSDGYTGDIYCVGCKKMLSKGEVVPKLTHDDPTHGVVSPTDCSVNGHNYKAYIVTAAEFTMGGTKYVCMKCGDEYWDNYTKKDTSEVILMPSGKDFEFYITPNLNSTTNKDNVKNNPILQAFLQDPSGTLKRMEDDGIKLYEITEGAEQVVVRSDKKIVFRSDAPFDEFDQVMINGLVLDKKYYSVKKGSTIVTLNEDFVKQIPTGMHLFGIISKDGVAITTFTVDDKAAADNDTKSPQTGDNSHMALWIALLAASVFGLAGTAVYSKRKRVR